MNYLAIIQARMGSTRLPNKVMMDLSGKPVIDHVVRRVKQSKLIDDVIVATSIDINNLPLVKYCSESGTRVFIGSENDVLDRFYQCARLIKPKNIVRITADCPLHDPNIIDKVISVHHKANADYTSNINPPTFPDGLDTEVFTFNSLKIAWEKATLKSEREHVTPYIKQSGLFTCNNVSNKRDLSNKRWTLDEMSDYHFISQIYSKLLHHDAAFGMNEIEALLDKEPELEELNKSINRNEGYIKSIGDDKILT